VNPAVSPARLLERAASAAHLLVVSDFDGTLAPLHDDPSEVRPVEGTPRILADLAAAPRTHAAILSGRTRDDLRRLLGEPTGVMLLGTFGLESDAASGEPSEGERRLMERLVLALGAVAAREPGALVERKTLGVSFHVRGVDPTRHAMALTFARAAASGVDRFHEVHGRDVFEFLTRSASKAAALQRLRALHPTDEVVFLGDDLPDEEVFADPTVWSIKVGPGMTHAQSRLDTPDAAVAWLARLADARGGAGGAEGTNTPEA
jgi:trehalose 6-phosphate phosphatase